MTSPSPLAPPLPRSGFPATSAVDSRDLFVAGAGGYDCYRIPALLRTAAGTLLAVCEGRRHGAGDAGDIDLLLRRSTDGGDTWSSPVVVWDDGPHTCGNPCVVQDETTGTLWLAATHNRGDDTETDIIHRRAAGTRWPWMLRSDDDGLTWSAPRPLDARAKDPAWGWYATGPGIGLQLRHGPRAGRLLIPCVHSYDNPSGSVRGGPYDYGSHVLYSDDHGHSWQLGGTIRPRVNECQLAELSAPPGRLLMNMRSYHGRHCRAEAWSDDGGLTWTPPADQPALVEQRCQASLLRHGWPEAEEPGPLLFANPADPDGRTRLTVRLSLDDGRTWPRRLVLWEGPAAYSSLARLSPDTAACLYERGDSRACERITIARFPLAALHSSPA